MEPRAEARRIRGQAEGVGARADAFARIRCSEGRKEGSYELASSMVQSRSYELGSWHLAVKPNMPRPAAWLCALYEASAARILSSLDPNPDGVWGHGAVATIGLVLGLRDHFAVAQN